MGATSFANVVVALAIEDTIKTVRSSRILPPRIGNVRLMFKQQLPFCFSMHLFYVEPSTQVWSGSEMPKKLRPQNRKRLVPLPVVAGFPPWTEGALTALEPR